MSFSEKVYTSLKSLVICDSRFESQIAIAVKSRDLEHLGDHFVSEGMNKWAFLDLTSAWSGISSHGLATTVCRTMHGFNKHYYEGVEWGYEIAEGIERCFRGFPSWGHKFQERKGYFAP